MTWQPISTAPKTGERIRLWSDRFKREMHAKWFQGMSSSAWISDAGDAMALGITHWQPCSPPPAGPHDWFEGQVDVEVVKSIVALKRLSAIARDLP